MTGYVNDHIKFVFIDGLKHSVSEPVELEIIKLRKEVTQLTAANKWVSVSERSPIENKPVLVSVKGYVYPKIGWHCHNIEIPQWSTADDLYFHDISYSEVTHWQPLPPPSAGGENE